MAIDRSQKHVADQRHRDLVRSPVRAPREARAFIVKNRVNLSGVLQLEVREKSNTEERRVARRKQLARGSMSDASSARPLVCAGGPFFSGLVSEVDLRLLVEVDSELHHLLEGGGEVVEEDLLIGGVRVDVALELRILDQRDVGRQHH